MKKDISNEKDATKDASKAKKRPKLQSTYGNPFVESSPSKIRRIAQPMGVLFAKRDVDYCSIKTKKPPASTSGFWPYIILGVLTPKQQNDKLSLGKGSLKVNFNLQPATREINCCKTRSF